MKKFFRKHTHTTECEGGKCPQKCTLSGEMFISMSILIAAILVSGSILYTNKANTVAVYPSQGDGQQQQPQQNDGSFTNVRPISKDDYIRGNAKAPITIVEYSDLECPFCKNFHNTLKGVLEKNGDKVSWVYRHAPLDQLHKKARKEAEAVECAGDLGGNSKFWAYMDRLMEVTTSNDGLDLAQLPKIAEYVGLNASKFNACLESGKFATKIQEDLDNVLQSGFRGTPYSIVFVKGVPKDIIPGALPISLKGDPSGQRGVQEIIDDLLKTL